MSSAELEASLKEAIACHKAGKIAEAEALYRIVLSRSPDTAVAMENLGLILHKANRLDEAIKLLRRAIEAEPRYPLFYRNLAVVYRAAGNPQQAVIALRRAVELAPEDGLCWGDLGVSLDLSGCLAEAYAVYEKAIRLLTPLVQALGVGGGMSPDETSMELARAHYNHGSVLGRWGRIEEAMGDYETSIRIKPDFAESHRNRAGVLFNRGKFKEAWAEYEWRWRCADYPGKPPNFPQAMWDGSDLGGRTILLWWEQGFGDTLQFCRYAPLIKARGGRVALLCQRELKRLLQTLDGVDELAYNGERKVEFDMHASLMSIPHLMGTDRETIPAFRSYLRADAADAAEWERRLAGDGAGYRVGLVWAGGNAHKNDLRRSVPFSFLEPLTALPGFRFYSLQLGDPAEQFRNSSAAGRVIDHTSHLRDFADSAAFIDRLDLLISVDTAPAHVAGALGKPVWTLMAHEPDFRWMTDTDNPSRWYPSMRHFRQSVLGDWKPVIARVIQELATKSPPPNARLGGTK